MQNKTELTEQQEVMEWAEYQTGKYPELKLLYHIPNEGKRSVVNGANLKKAGLKKVFLICACLLQEAVITLFT